ncbi:60Kd inner membrane protein-domain-containing protein [Lipomyces arxii]|uniref:60Kd inner membrane protein-domain-containing protein n=1 Tax=Lipomyces arxii TaxID=56418 RepID=UPI0034CE93B3
MASRGRIYVGRSLSALTSHQSSSIRLSSGVGILRTMRCPNAFQTHYSVAGSLAGYRYFSFGRSQSKPDPIEDNAWKSSCPSEFVEDTEILQDPSASDALNALSVSDESVPEVLKASVESVNGSGQYIETSNFIGYLESIGQAQSWIHPSDISQHLLEMCHVYGGLTWGASIIAVTVALRVLAFPVFVKSSDMGARSAALKPQMDKLLADYMSTGSATANDIHEMQLKRKRLLQSHGISMRWMLAPLVVNLVIGFGMFLGLERLANADIPDFKHDQTPGLWFEDLSGPDPYYILNVFPALLLTLMFQRGGETGIQSMGPQVKRIMMAAPIVSIVFTIFLPTAVLLYFGTTSTMSLLQALILQSPRFRSLTKMKPLIKPQPVSAETKESLRTFWESAKKAAEDQARKRPP